MKLLKYISYDRTDIYRLMSEINTKFKINRTCLLCKGVFENI